jgi:hypothetical protein
VWSICLRVASGEIAGRADVVGLRRLGQGAWCEARRDRDFLFADDRQEIGCGSSAIMVDPGRPAWMPEYIG